MPKAVTKSPAPEPVIKTAKNQNEDQTSLRWVRDTFELFGQSKKLDQSVGQDALYVAVKMSPADRDVLTRVLRELLKGGGK